MTYIEKPKRVLNGYQPLANVLQDALDQAQAGKGSQRHANGKPFLEQPIITDGRACGLAGPAFQARKKILEALRCPDEERAVQDLLGAIVYTAAMVILKEEGRQKREDVPKMNADLFEPWQAAISEQEAQVRAQVATSAQGREVMDSLASACGYIIPQMEDGDDDPAVVHIVPDRTSRATLTTDTALPFDDDQEELSVEDQERIYRVPDRTSRATLPDECPGAMCGRVRG